VALGIGADKVTDERISATALLIMLVPLLELALTPPEPESDAGQLDLGEFWQDALARVGAQCGRTKVFMRDRSYAELECFRAQSIAGAALSMQRYLRGYKHAKAFRTLRQAAQLGQRVYRGYRGRKLYAYVRQTHYILVVQRAFRCFAARKAVANKRAQKDNIGLLVNWARMAIVRRRFRKVLRGVTQLQSHHRRRACRSLLSDARREANSVHALQRKVEGTEAQLQTAQAQIEALKKLLIANNITTDGLDRLHQSNGDMPLMRTPLKMHSYEELGTQRISDHEAVAAKDGGDKNNKSSSYYPSFASPSQLYESLTSPAKGSDNSPSTTTSVSGVMTFFTTGSTSAGSASTVGTETNSSAGRDSNKDASMSTPQKISEDERTYLKYRRSSYESPLGIRQLSDDGAGGKGRLSLLAPDVDDDDPADLLTPAAHLARENLVVHIIDFDTKEDLGYFGRSMPTYYTSYRIASVTMEGAPPVAMVERRYNDFVWLHGILQAAVPEVVLPALPGKRYLGSNLDPSFIKARRAQLEDYLQEVHGMFFGDVEGLSPVVSSIVACQALTTFLGAPLGVKRAQHHQDPTRENMLTSRMSI